MSSLLLKLKISAEILFTQIREHILGIFILGVGFLPGVFRESFWSDDYTALNETNSMAMHALRDARPVQALEVKFSYSFVVHSVADGWKLRTMAFIGLVCLYLYTVRRLAHIERRRFLEIGVATAFCTSSFQMQIHWATAWIFPWVSLLAWIAFDVWSSTFRFKKIISIFLMSISLLIYPLSSVFFISAVSVLAILRGETNRSVLKQLRDGFILLAVSSAFSAAVVFSAFKFLVIHANQRVGLVALSDLPTKVVWFLTRPIVIGLRPFQISSPSSIQALLSILPVLILFLVGVLATQKFQIRNSIFRVITVGISVSASLFPLLVTSPNEFEYRMISGYAWAVVVLIFFYLLQLNELREFFSSRWIRQGIDRLLSVLLICITLLGIFTLNLYYFKFIGDPYTKKTAFFLTSIR